MSRSPVGRNSSFDLVGRIEPGVAHLERIEDVLLCELIERRSADALDEFTKHDEVHIRVTESRADGCFELECRDA